jgi:hypothetical protein
MVALRTARVIKGLLFIIADTICPLSVSNRKRAGSGASVHNLKIEAPAKS